MKYQLRHKCSGLQRLICLLVLLCCSLSPACAQQRVARTLLKNPTVDSQAGASAAWSQDIPDLVQFPSAEVEFIAGPQLKVGSTLNPFTWYDQTAINKGLEHGVNFPASPPVHPLSGSVSATKDSKTIVGVGTRFQTDFSGKPYTNHLFIEDADRVPRDYIVTSVEDDTHLSVSVAWQQASTSDRRFSKATGDEFDEYINLNYYDQGLCQYVNYYRTGDPRFLTIARKLTDSWWKAPFIAEGHCDVSSSLAPRNISLNGLILRALDGRPEMWPWITSFVREQFETWVGLRVSYSGFYYGLRDPGYMLLYAANLARVHPDQTVRAEFRKKALDAAVKLYARLQSSDGGFYFNLDEVENTTQPFQVGLLVEGLIAVHRLTGDETVKKVILKSAEHQYNRCYNARGWRGMYYFVGGKTRDKNESCDSGCGAAANPYPPADPGQVSEVRQLNATAIHHFGYAYLVSGDERYRKWGDEILDATFSGRDGHRGLANARPKEYDESFRSSGKYLAWRLAGGVASLPTPSSTPKTTVEVPSQVIPRPQLPSDPSADSTGIEEELNEAVRLAKTAPSASEVEALLSQIQKTSQEMRTKLPNPSSADEVRAELDAASTHLQTALAIIRKTGPPEDTKVRLTWAAARLKRASERYKAVLRRPQP
jgi:hypothetical protein